MKKLLSLAIAIALLCAALPAFANVQSRDLEYAPHKIKNAVWNAEAECADGGWRNLFSKERANTISNRLGSGQVYSKIVPVWFDGDWTGDDESWFNVKLPRSYSKVVCVLTASPIGQSAEIIGTFKRPNDTTVRPCIPASWIDGLHKSQWVGVLIILYVK